MTNQTHPPAAPSDGRRVLPLDSDRRQFVGASDVAAILGLSKWRTPLQVYLQKRGDLPETATSPVMEWGNRLEESVRQAYADKCLPGHADIIRGAEIGRVVHPTTDWMVCSPDGIIAVDGAWHYGLECKTADRAVAHLWGDSGTDHVPDAYALQCHYSMAITGLDRWDVAVLIGGNDFRWYTLRRDDDLIATVLPALAEFWGRVQAGEAPTPAAADNTLMARLFRQAHDELIEGDAEIGQLAEQLAVAKAVAAEQAELVEGIEARLKARIGDRAGAIGPWGKVSWKQNRDSEVVDWKAVARDAGATDSQVLAHTTVRPGARPFRVTFTTGGAA